MGAGRAVTGLADGPAGINCSALIGLEWKGDGCTSQSSPELAFHACNRVAADTTAMTNTLAHAYITHMHQYNARAALRPIINGFQRSEINSQHNKIDNGIELHDWLTHLHIAVRARSEYDSAFGSGWFHSSERGNSSESRASRCARLLHTRCTERRDISTSR